MAASARWVEWPAWPGARLHIRRSPRKPPEGRQPGKSLQRAAQLIAAIGDRHGLAGEAIEQGDRIAGYAQPDNRLDFVINCHHDAPRFALSAGVNAHSSQQAMRDCAAGAKMTRVARPIPVRAPRPRRFPGCHPGNRIQPQRQLSMKQTDNSCACHRNPCLNSRVASTKQNTRPFEYSSPGMSTGGHVPLI